jgi:hypothetical protein
MEPHAVQELEGEIDLGATRGHEDHSYGVLGILRIINGQVVGYCLGCRVGEALGSQTAQFVVQVFRSPRLQCKGDGIDHMTRQ